jgi:hypothetical protein
MAHQIKLGALAAALVLSAPVVSAQAQLPPTLPPGCEAIKAPPGNHVSNHVYALGVQVYTWNGTTKAWDFVEPKALLFDSFFRVVGTHYRGPTWESNGGSSVVGSRVDGCSPNPHAIPWLLLRAVSSQGTGPFLNTTFIQRVNTLGGLAPTRAGSTNEVVNVPYFAEYYFYRAN